MLPIYCTSTPFRIRIWFFPLIINRCCAIILRWDGKRGCLAGQETPETRLKRRPSLVCVHDKRKSLLHQSCLLGRVFFCQLPVRAVWAPYRHGGAMLNRRQRQIPQNPKKPESHGKRFFRGIGFSERRISMKRITAGSCIPGTQQQTEICAIIFSIRKGTQHEYEDRSPL